MYRETKPEVIKTFIKSLWTTGVGLFYDYVVITGAITLVIFYLFFPHLSSIGLEYVVEVHKEPFDLYKSILLIQIMRSMLR